MTICIVCNKCIITHLKVVWSEFWWLTISIIQQIYDFLILHSLNIFIIIITENSSTICCHFSGGMYTYLGTLVVCVICVDFFFWIFIWYPLQLSLWLCDLFCNLISNQIVCCFSCFLDQPFWGSLKDIQHPCPYNT